MINKKTLLIAFVTLLLAVMVFKKFFASSDEEAIDNLLTQIEELAEFEKPLPPLSTTNRIARLIKLLNKDIQIDYIGGAQVRTSKGIEPIKSSALLGSRMVITNGVQRYGTEINVTDSKATANFYIILEGRDQDNQRYKEIFSVNCQLSKNTDAHWTVSALTIERMTPEDSTNSSEG